MPKSHARKTVIGRGTMPSSWRDRIQAAMIVKRLEGFVKGDDDQGKKIELSPAQVTAALGLLRKCVPDIAAIQLSTDPENPPTFTITWKDKP